MATYPRPFWQVKPPEVTVYQASYTLTKLHLSNQQPLPFAQLRGIMGPLGSGKSVGMCWEIMQQAHRVPANAEGVRQSKWVVIRNTYRELEDTTLETWFDWFPEAKYGRFLRRGMTHEVRRNLADGTTLELDVIFRALDKPQDVRKLLSLELTGAWINEAREIPLAVLDMVRKRVGRFPKWGSIEPYWHGVIMDTNPCEEDHWFYRYAEETDWNHQPELLAELERRGFPVTQADIEKMAIFYRQPSGRSPGAENLANLSPGYYSTAGYAPEWIKVYIDGEYGYVQTGKAVYPEFYEQLHFVPELAPIRAVIYVGLDFGLTPAAAFIQQDARGRFLCIDELVTQNMGATQFAESLSQHIATHYQGYEFRFYGDPAGDERSSIDANQTVFDVLRANGINAVPAPCPGNDWILRRDAVGVPLNRLIDGRPGLVIGGKCRYIRMGLAGKYNYKRVQVVGDEKYHNKPDKNDYSHPVEALQYGMLGAGSNPAKPKGLGRTLRVPTQAQTTFNPWEAFTPWPTFRQPERLRTTSGPGFRERDCSFYTNSSPITYAARQARRPRRFRPGAASLARYRIRRTYRPPSMRRAVSRQTHRAAITRSSIYGTTRSLKA